MLVRLAAGASAALLLAVPAHGSTPLPPMGPCAPGSFRAAKLYTADGYAKTPTATHEVQVAIALPDEQSNAPTITLPPEIKRDNETRNWPPGGPDIFPRDPTIEESFGILVTEPQTIPIEVTWLHFLEDRRNSPTCTASTTLPLTLVAPTTGPKFSRVRRVTNSLTNLAGLTWTIPEMNRATADMRPLTIEFRAGTTVLRRRGPVQNLGFNETQQKVVKPFRFGRDELQTFAVRRTHTSYAFQIVVPAGPRPRRARYEVIFRRDGKVLRRISGSARCGQRTICRLGTPVVRNR